MGIVCYLGKVPLSRGFFVLSFLIGVPLLVLGRLLLRRGLHAARRRGLFLHRVLVAGSAAHIDEIATIMRRESWLGYRVAGPCAPTTRATSKPRPLVCRTSGRRPEPPRRRPGCAPTRSSWPMARS